MTKRALLINPWITDFAAYDFWARPLGLLWIGAILKSNGINVDFIDCLARTGKEYSTSNLLKVDGSGKYFKTEMPKPEILSFVPRKYGRYGISVDEFTKQLGAVEKPNVVMFTSSMTYWYPGVFDVIEIVKEMWPDVKIILGGRYTALCTEHAVKNSGADFVIPGFPGAAFQSKVSEILDTQIIVPSKFSDYPMPAHELMKDTSIASVAASIGCPYKCSYCVTNNLSGGFQTREPAVVMEELRYLVETLGTKHIAFYDDAILVNAEKMINPILRFIIENKLRTNYYNPNAMHARLVTEETADLMKAAGFTHLRIGYEFADESYQKKTGGKVNTQEIQHAVKILKAAGFRTDEIGVYILCGHPAQKYETIKNAVDVVIAAGAAPTLAEYSPIPGSPDFEDAVKSFIRDPSTDPLLQNSSIILFQHPEITRRQFEDIKVMVKNTRNGMNSRNA